VFCKIGPDNDASHRYTIATLLQRKCKPMVQTQRETGRVCTVEPHRIK
jgi:hypothetical protein